MMKVIPEMRPRIKFDIYVFNLLLETLWRW